MCRQTRIQRSTSAAFMANVMNRYHPLLLLFIITYLKRVYASSDSNGTHFREPATSMWYGWYANTTLTKENLYLHNFPHSLHYHALHLILQIISFCSRYLFHSPSRLLRNNNNYYVFVIIFCSVHKMEENTSRFDAHASSWIHSLEAQRYFLLRCARHIREDDDNEDDYSENAPLMNDDERTTEMGSCRLSARYIKSKQ